MIYTYDKNTLEVISFSDGSNTYSNPNWVDIEYDETPSLAWLTRQNLDQKLKYSDGIIILE